MKKTACYLSACILLFTACKKNNNTPAALSETISGTTLATGSFTGSAHATSGTVKVIKDAASKIYLVFENFNVDNGPDLKVWLSPNNSGSPYQEVGVLKAASGNFYYELGTSFNYTNNNRVLIWCKQFTVLFGYAVLQ
jgi:Electron transfer DM13